MRTFPLCLLIWFCLLPQVSTAEPKSSQPRELTRKEQAELNGRLAWVRDLVRDRYGLKISLIHRGDLSVLQRVVDERLVASSDTVSYQSLGLAFGNIVVHGLDYHWVMVTDELGTDYAMQFRRTSILGFPLTVISKRIERREPIDLKKFYDFYSQSRTIKADSAIP